MTKTNWKQLYLDAKDKGEMFERAYDRSQEENLALLSSDVVIRAKSWMLKDAEFLKNIRVIFVGDNAKLHLNGDVKLGRLNAYGTGTITFEKAVTFGVAKKK